MHNPIGWISRRWNARVDAWMARHHPRRAGEYEINRKRIYILPTRAGWAYAVICLIVLLAAMNYSNSLAFMLAFWLGAIGFLTMHETHANLINTAVRLGPPDAVFAGETAFQPVLLRNRGRKPRMALKASTDRKASTAIQTQDCIDESEALLAWTPQQRGVHPVPRFSMSSDWPLGLFRSWSWVHAETYQVVYPRPEPHSEGPPPHPAEPEDGGTDQPGDEELSGLRDYIPGDSLRTIHWRSLAAHDQLASKAFTAPVSDAQWVDLAALPSNLNLEQKLSRLCRIILDLHAQRQTYGLRLGTMTISPASGDSQRDRCLEALARYG